MVTYYVLSKLTNVTMIVGIVVDSPFALEIRCAFATNLLRCSQSGLKLLFYFFHAWTVRRLCLTGTNRARSTNTKQI